MDEGVNEWPELNRYIWMYLHVRLSLRAHTVLEKNNGGNEPPAALSHHES
jgi:hypothetical protein